MSAKGITWIIVILAVGAVIAFLAIQAKKLMNYCFTLANKKTKVYEASVNSLEIDYFIRFKNTSNIDVEVDSYDFNIDMNGIKIANVKSNTKQIVKAGQFTDFKISIDASPKEIFKSDKNKLLEIGKYFITDKSKIVFNTVGTVTAGALGVKAKNVPVSVPYTLKEMLEPSTEEMPCR